MNISLEERIYGLSLIWREAKYNFANWDLLPDLDWDKAYNEFLPLIIAAENPYNYYMELKRFIALLRDGHTWVQMPDELNPPYIVPFGTAYYEGKHILIRTPKNYESLLYSEIISVNRTPLKEYLEKYVFPYMWHEKIDSVFHEGSMLAYYINCREQGNVTIETANGNLSYNHGETIETVYGNLTNSLKHDEFLTMRNIVKVPDVLYIDITSDNIAYILVCTFAEETLKEELYKNIDLFKDCAGFLIDVRWNSGGNSDYAHTLEQLFIDGKFPEAPSAYKSSLYIASFGAYGQYKDLNELDLNDPQEKIIYDISKRKSFYCEEPKEIWIKDCPAYLNRPVVILSGCETASASEGFLDNMRTFAKAKIVGTPSFGSGGQPFFGELPGGGQYGICTMKCSCNNVGIQPDIFIENKIDDHKNRYDAMFDKGLSVLRDMLRCKK